MDPFFARNRLSAYLDGALSDTEAAEVAEAIEGDPELRSEFDAMRRAVELLRRHGPSEAPEGFHARVMGAVRDEPGPTGVVVWMRRAFARVPVEAVALAAAAAIVLVVIQGRSGPARPLSPELPDRSAVHEMASAAAPPPQPAPGASTGGVPSADSADSVPSANDLPTTTDLPPADDKATPPRAPSAAQAGAPRAGSTRTPPPPQTKKAAGANASLARKTWSGQTIKEPYVPEWEQARQAGDSRLDAEDALDVPVKDDTLSYDMAMPYGYRLTGPDSEMLYQLSVLARQAGGQLLDGSGQAISPHSLSVEDDYLQVQIIVPQGNGETVRSGLSGMGATHSPPPATTPLHGAGQVGFIIEVQYTP